MKQFSILTRLPLAQERLAQEQPNAKYKILRVNIKKVIMFLPKVCRIVRLNFKSPLQPWGAQTSFCSWRWAVTPLRRCPPHSSVGTSITSDIYMLFYMYVGKGKGEGRGEGCFMFLCFYAFMLLWIIYGSVGYV